MVTSQSGHLICANRKGHLCCVNCEILGGTSLSGTAAVGGGKLSLIHTKVTGGRTREAPNEHTVRASIRQRGCLVVGASQLVAVGTVFELTGGAAVEVKGGSRSWLAHCRLSDCGRAGLLVQGDSTANIVHSQIIRPSWAAVEASRRSHVLAQRLTLKNGQKGGVLLIDSASADLKFCRIQGFRLAGADVRGGSLLRLRACTVADGHGHGIFVHQNGQSQLQQVTVQTHKRGFGLFVDATAQVMVHHNTARVGIQFVAQPQGRQCNVKLPLVSNAVEE